MIPVVVDSDDFDFYFGYLQKNYIFDVCVGSDCLHDYRFDHDSLV